MNYSTYSPNPPPTNGGGGGFLSGMISRVARTAFDSVMSEATKSTAEVNGDESPEGASDVPGGQYQVIEYFGKQLSDEIASIYPTSLKAGQLILHGPRNNPDATPSSASYLLYNIILHATNATHSSEKMYSVFRTDLEDEASRVFVIYKQIFPDLVKASIKPMDKETLEKVVRMSKQNESYQAAHIAAALGMIEQLKSPILRDKFAEQEVKDLYTPLQVAAVHGKLEAVKVICEDERQLNQILGFLDIKGNSIVHLAVEIKDQSTSAGVLKVLKEKLLQQSSPQWESTHRTLLNLLLNQFNNEGLVPLHVACINSNQEAAEEILSVIDKNTSNLKRQSSLDIKARASGSTPLHFAVQDPNLVIELLYSGSDPNIKDKEGLTPLHKAVLLKNLKSALHILSNGGLANFKATFETYKEVTPLHIAAYNCSMDCVKALIVFGADMDVHDGNGHTARHIVAAVCTPSNYTKNEELLFVLAAAGAKRCGLRFSEDCADGCRSDGIFNGKTPEKWRINRDGTTTDTIKGSGGQPENLVREAMRGMSAVRESLDIATQFDPIGDSGNGPVVGDGGRLLSLDGGGIRGLVLTQILYYMEKEFENLEGGDNPKPIISYFDWVAGTSTGGILALALASGKSVLETQSLYMKLKNRVFTGARPYSATRMEEFLKKEFGAERKMSSIEKPKVMIMTSLANRRPPDLYIFRNYMSPSCLVGDVEEYTQYPDDTFIWETAKVTGAAPSYFTLHDDVFIDGGFISNNPTLDALSEMAQFRAVMIMGSEQKGRSNETDGKSPSFVLSLGTGIPAKEKCAATNLDISWPTGVMDAVSYVPRLTQLVNLLVDQATQSEGQVVERSRAWCTTVGVPFFRFSPEMSEYIDLDEKEDDVLVNLMWETWCYMVGNKGRVREIFERLREPVIGGNGDSRTPTRSHENSPEEMDTR